MTSVSIVLATYNGARFLDRQLQSLRDQATPPDELIITDDRSTDDTVDIARRFASDAPFPVKVVVNDTQLNFRGNFFSGVSLATGDLIMFCDQDDVWRPNKVAVMKAFFDENPDVLLAYHHATVVDQEERPLSAVGDPAQEGEYLGRAVPPPWHFARGLLQTFRRELLAFDHLIPVSREHFSDDILGHDRWYFLLALAQKRLAFVNQDLLLYRQHGANAFGSDRPMTLGEKIAARLEHHAESDRYGRDGARSRASILRAMAPMADPAVRQHVETLAVAYEEYADRLERRYRTFSAPSVVKRATAMTRSVAARDYRGNPWGFDQRSVVRDLISGVAGYRSR